MGAKRLRHDAAWAIATTILECIENCIRPEEQKDASHELYWRVKAGIECYDLMVEREQQRLKPSEN